MTLTSLPELATPNYSDEKVKVELEKLKMTDTYMFSMDNIDKFARAGHSRPNDDNNKDNKWKWKWDTKSESNN